MSAAGASSQRKLSRADEDQPGRGGADTEGELATLRGQGGRPGMIWGSGKGRTAGNRGLLGQVQAVQEDDLRQPVGGVQRAG